MLLVYMTIYPQQDPLLALSLGFVSLLLVSWGISFFLFLWWNRGMGYFKNFHDAAAHCYKISFLFALCVFANGLLIMSGRRNRRIGVISFVIALSLQGLLTSTTLDHDDSY